MTRLFNLQTTSSVPSQDDQWHETSSLHSAGEEIVAYPQPGSGDDTTPPWGTLPAEQYLIRHWDMRSSASDADQRAALVRAFLALDEIPRAWDGVRDYNYLNVEIDIRLPTDEEVARILRPWRPLRWRAAAVGIWRQLGYRDAIWLRTHYATGDGDNTKEQQHDNAMLEAWTREEMLFSSDEASWRLLDDPEMFQFGSDWARVFSVLPELASEAQCYSRLLEGPEACEYTHVCLAESRAALRAQVRTAVDKERTVEVSEDGVGLQLLACKRFLVVADKEAFATDKPLFLFLDAWGNLIRETRMSAVDMADDGVVYFETDRLASEEWFVNGIIHDAEHGRGLGTRYAAHGELGRQLYQVEDLLHP